MTAASGPLHYRIGLIQRRAPPKLHRTYPPTTGGTSYRRGPGKKPCHAVPCRVGVLACWRVGVSRCKTKTLFLNRSVLNHGVGALYMTQAQETALHARCIYAAEALVSVQYNEMGDNVPPDMHRCMVMQGSRHGDARLMTRQCTVSVRGVRWLFSIDGLLAAHGPPAHSIFPHFLRLQQLFRGSAGHSPSLYLLPIPIPSRPPCPQPAERKSVPSRDTEILRHLSQFQEPHLPHPTRATVHSHAQGHPILYDPTPWVNPGNNSLPPWTYFQHKNFRLRSPPSILLTWKPTNLLERMINGEFEHGFAWAELENTRQLQCIVRVRHG
ncbi:hypothetical protein B0H16DRAFT_1474472 [Mycena metata]|uniref:Uncharacterized protein n=1 Tax=Mycena metata TaxID=1033252 RepID=A0AAD7HHW3_9AGAR|nr:hypothetical protein B0H16DRAFT_1474472 [Mycena metata]